MILLLDTFSLLFRAHYALPPMTTSRGEPTSALYGLSVLLLKLLREHAPEAIGFALDSGPSFRRSLDSAYKAHRGPTPEELARQLEVLPSLIEALSGPALFAPGFEADDVLATLTAELTQAGQDVLLVSGDRDLFQVVGPRARVLFVGRRGQDHVLYDEAAVEARYGLAPAQLPAFVALTGDASDNIPKVPGVGPKTAAEWIRRYHDVNRVLSNLDALRPVRLQAAVAAHDEQIRRAEQLARLRTDAVLAKAPVWVPLAESALERLKTFFQTWEFASLVARVDALPRGHER